MRGRTRIDPVDVITADVSRGERAHVLSTFVVLPVSVIPLHVAPLVLVPTGVGA